ncbi:MAG: hypothetical protein IID38_12225 [Planctomycetes bacterium]|nr:hypothetical protein [Planctomycetota bacterium]
MVLPALSQCGQRGIKAARKGLVACQWVLPPRGDRSDAAADQDSGRISQRPVTSADDKLWVYGGQAGCSEARSGIGPQQPMANVDHAMLATWIEG